MTRALLVIDVQNEYFSGKLPVSYPPGSLENILKTKKTAISRIENHAEDIKLSTLERVAVALGKRLQVSIR